MYKTRTVNNLSREEAHSLLVKGLGYSHATAETIMRAAQYYNGAWRPFTADKRSQISYQDASYWFRISEEID
jgi:hypothetical protein